MLYCIKIQQLILNTLLYDTHDLPCSIYKVSNHHAYILCDMW